MPNAIIGSKTVLEMKVDTVEKELEYVREKIEEGHRCMHEDLLSIISRDIKEVKTCVETVRTVKAKSVITAVVAIVTAILGAGVFIFQAKADAGVVNQKIEDTKARVEEYRADVRVIVDDIKRQGTKWDEAILLMRKVDKKLDLE